MNSSVSPRRRGFMLALREALIVLAAGAGLGLAYGALTHKGLFSLPAESRDAPSAPRAETPVGPMMVSVDEAEKLFRQGEALFVDARSEFDFRLGHIKGAMNLPLKDATKDRTLLPGIEHDRLVITYCDGQNCNSSIDLAARLYALGFRRVRIFFGGWEEWQARHLPVEETAP